MYSRLMIDGDSQMSLSSPIQHMQNAALYCTKAPGSGLTQTYLIPTFILTGNSK